MRYLVALLVLAALFITSADARSRASGSASGKKEYVRSKLLKKKKRVSRQYYPADRGKEPIPEYLQRKMQELGMSASTPVLIRIFKQEYKLEVWKQDVSGRYAYLRSYQICKYSGDIGPKLSEGDKQTPEGFYAVTTELLNPDTKNNYLSMNIGFPNPFDRAHERTGSYIMIHGGCSSIGCFAMTHGWIKEIYALVREALDGGQAYVPVHVFPFRMNRLNMELHRFSKHYAFWKNLKEGYDYFEATGREPLVGVCEKRYIFNSSCKVDLR